MDEYQIIKSPLAGGRRQFSDDREIHSSATAKMDEYRILQLSDNTWGIEKARHFTKGGKWPWSKRIPCKEWVVALGFPGHPYPFPSLEKALKWIGDDRKFPIVVGHIPPESA